MYTLEENLKRFRSKERAEFEDTIEREEEQQRIAPILAAQAEQNRLRVAIQEVEREGILAGRPDPSWQLPESAQNLRMSIEQAKQFAQDEAGKFVEDHPEYYRCRENFEKITNYLTTNGVVIPDAECFRLAFERLRDLGLLTEKPEPEQAPEPQPTVEVQQIDPEAERERKRQEYFTKPVANYAGKDYSQADLDRLSADEFRRVVGLYGENLPRFSNVMNA